MNEDNKPQTANCSQPQITVDEAFAQALDHFHAERFTQADQLCTAIINAFPAHSYAINLLGLIAQKLNRHDLAIEQFEKAIVVDSNVALFYYNLGISFNSLGLLEDAVEAQKKALLIDPNYTEALNSLGSLFVEVGSFTKAVESLKKAITINPNYAYAHYNIANALVKQGKVDDAVSSYQKAISLNPNFAEAYNNFGIVLQEQKKHKEAAISYQKAVSINPNFADALSNLGNALLEIGELDAAVLNCKKAIAIKANYADAYCNLGNAQLKLENLDEAANSFKKAISINPNFAAAYYNLGVVFHKQIKFAEAISCNQKAIAIQPKFANAYCNIGFIYTDQSRYDDAIFNYQKAMEIEPENASIHSNYILCIDLFSGVETDLFQIERKNWVKQHAEPLGAFDTNFNNIPEISKKLKIGYVGADFLDHSAAHIFGDMLLNYDENKFDIFCYVGNIVEDKITEQFKKKVTSWQLTTALDDATLANKIKTDGIDILVDLAGHSKGNRLLTFARKPAPIQISAWGYPHGTAMAAMDYIFADPIFIPYSERKKYSEDIIDLSCVIHLTPHANYPEVTEPPVLKNGYITFGGFNRLEKNSYEVYLLWVKILQRLPQAKLLMKTLKLESSEIKKEIENFFAANGIDKNRLILIGKTTHQEHLQIHKMVDIMLDPFPHNGGMTTLESVRMGVPVLTCEKETRCPTSASILHVMGLDEWRVKDKPGFLEKAVEFASDTDKLKTLRQQMRNRFDKSVLGNSKLYTSQVEAVYRKLWEKWCEENS
ncbi:MAG: tetratricopeptide repeat protein [Magnetococcales bacterium]|nr:tetratricopeptide repeat protein [Magnetococcales bacterium]